MVGSVGDLVDGGRSLLVDANVSRRTHVFDDGVAGEQQSGHHAHQPEHEPEDVHGPVGGATRLVVVPLVVVVVVVVAAAMCGQYCRR